MITLIEQALAAFFNVLIGNAGLAAPALAVPAVNKSTAPEDRTIVICQIHDMPHDGGGLYRAMLRITVESPADVPAVTAATHAAVENLVTAGFYSANATALSDAITAADASLAYGNTFVEGWKPGRAETNWLPSFEVILGIDRSS